MDKQKGFVEQLLSIHLPDYQKFSRNSSAVGKAFDKIHAGREIRCPEREIVAAIA